jgi:hypothetical protein
LQALCGSGHPGKYAYAGGDAAQSGMIFVRIVIPP